jgi:hypothetical protein
MKQSGPHQARIGFEEKIAKCQRMRVLTQVSAGDNFFRLFFRVRLREPQRKRQSS